MYYLHQHLLLSIQFFSARPSARTMVKKGVHCLNLLAVHFYSQQSRKNVIPKESVCYWMHLLKLNFHLRLMV